MRLWTFLKIFKVYLGILLWPVGLHMERTVELAASPGSLPVLAGGSLLAGLLAGAWACRKRLPVTWFGVLWFVLALLPVSNLFVVTSGLLYEHWLYFPMIGFVLALVDLGCFWGQRGKLQQWALGGIFVVFLTFLSVRTILRNRDWRDPITFYTQTLQRAPHSYRITNNLARAHADAGQYSQAEALFKKAITLNPSDPLAHHNLGTLYRLQGKKDLALEGFAAALKNDPQFLFSYGPLYELHMENKDYAKARQVLEKYLPYAPSKINTLLLLSKTALEEGNRPLARTYLERARTLDPHHPRVQSALAQLAGTPHGKEKANKLKE